MRLLRGVGYCDTARGERRSERTCTCLASRIAISSVHVYRVSRCYASGRQCYHVRGTVGYEVVDQQQVPVLVRVRVTRVHRELVDVARVLSRGLERVVATSARSYREGSELQG